MLLDIFLNIWATPGKYYQSDSSNSFDSRPLSDLCGLGGEMVEEPDSLLWDLSSVPAYLGSGQMVVYSADSAGYGGRMVCPYPQQKSCGWTAGNYPVLCEDRRVCGGHLCETTVALADGLGSLRILCFSADENYISENLRQFEVGKRSAEGGDLSVSQMFLLIDYVCWRKKSRHLSKT